MNLKNNSDPLVGFHKALGIETRIKLIQALVSGEKSVNELSEITVMSESAVSHQLKELRLANLVRFQRNGRKIFYSINDEQIKSYLTRTYELFNIRPKESRSIEETASATEHKKAGEFID